MPDTSMKSVKSVAERLGVKPDTVRGWIASGELTAINVSQTRGTLPRWRISPEALAEFEAGRCTIKPRKTKQPKSPANLPDDFVAYF